MMTKKAMIVLVLGLSLMGLGVGTALAGSTFDVGSLPGTPPVGEVNWIAWLTKNVTSGVPQQILTEDGTNPGVGTNQGYQIFAFPTSAPRWILQVANFTNEAANDEVNILLGGLGGSSGTLWGPHTFLWDTGTALTVHDDAASATMGPACPTQLQGSWDGVSEKIINWSGTPNTPHHIYRSQNPSGAGNGASNGRYTWLATASTDSGGSGTYTDTTATVESWHIVVPANPDGSLAGCHSEESNPTALTLAGADAQGGNLPSAYLILAGVLLVLTAAALAGVRRRPVARSAGS